MLYALERLKVVWGISMNHYSWLWQCVLFFNEFTRAFLYYVLLPLVLTHRFHMPIEWVGFCTSCQFAADASTKLLYGIVASRVYSRWIIRGGTAISGLSVLGLFFIHNSYLVLLFSVLFGCGAASIWPAALLYYSHIHSRVQGESMAKVFTPWLAGTGTGMFLPNILLYQRSNMYMVLCLSTVIVFSGTLLLHPNEYEITPSLQREIKLMCILFRKTRTFLSPMVLQTMVIGTITPFF